MGTLRLIGFIGLIGSIGALRLMGEMGALGISGYFWIFLGIIVMTALYPELPRATQFYPVLPIKL
jgi:hypothetical protein